MITEDYVSFETAKLLKEKGYEGVIKAYYHIWDNGNRVCSVQEFIHSEAQHLYFPAPTLQMAMKWLREKHNLHIGVLITYQYFPRKYEVHIMHTEKYEDIVVNPGTNFNTNEEACESAIRYTLENLI